MRAALLCILVVYVHNKLGHLAEKPSRGSLRHVQMKHALQHFAVVMFEGNTRIQARVSKIVRLAQSQ